MFEDKKSDLHMHLNGSFSIEFLERIAKKNNCKNIFLKLQAVRRKYQQACQNKIDKTSDADVVKIVWEQFGLIRQIIQTLDDIKGGTVDVIGHSKAKYLEIRNYPETA